MPIRSDYLRLSCGFLACIIAVSGCSPDTGTGTAEVTVTVAGGGTVSSLPAGIECGTDCSEDVVVGTRLTLTAIPDANFTFSGWSGGGCSGSGTCTLTVNANTAVTATFRVDQMLTVVPSGTGTGRVIASPGGIDCGADCSELYLPGTVVTLSAMADASSTFMGWSGAGCSGTGTCVVTMDGAHEVTTTFVLVRHELTVVRNGTGGGSVQSAPTGIDCNADCEQQYDHGTVVRLTATADVGSTFVGWSGGSCTGTGDCDVTVLAATTVTATFSSCSGSATFVYTGAMQTFTVPACATSITVDAYGAQGGASTGENGGFNFSGGLGARVRGTFAVTGGQVVNVLVGGQGATNNCGGAGGGGSFVVRSSAVPATSADIILIAAGGGGAMHCNYYGGTNGGGGQIANNGGSGVASTGGNPVPACVAGGTNGAGGRLNGWGGGGGGFSTSGLSAHDPAGGGQSFLAGGGGGNIGGGFGGGGGRYAWCCGGGGGGGGYSGGGGGSADGCAGGGGGSLNNGTSQTNSAAVRSGAGTVIISY